MNEDEVRAWRRRLLNDFAVARKSDELWDRDLVAGARVGDIITVESRYIINPDPNMQRVGDEPV